MSKEERESVFMSGYYQVLNQIEVCKHKTPSDYPVLKKFAENYRQYVIDVGRLDSVPKVPD